MKKPNCYECKYRGSVPGSCHSSCTHPKSGNEDNNIITGLLNKILDIDNKSKELNIKANPHGIRNGWFMWPFNFDPVWLENCDGFDKKDQ